MSLRSPLTLAPLRWPARLPGSCDSLHAEVQAIGSSAVNQAIKAIAIARNYLALDGIDLICFPEFVEIDIEGKERTAVKLIIEARA